MKHTLFWSFFFFLYFNQTIGSTMRSFKNNKLWRDNMIEVMEQNHGSKIHWRYLDDKEFDEKIRLKLLEEAHEVTNAKDRNELLTELADVYEVIDTLADLYEISRDEIISAQTKKRDKRGGFAKRKYVEKAEHPIGSYGEKYSLADPEKYPEIT